MENFPWISVNDELPEPTYIQLVVYIDGDGDAMVGMGSYQKNGEWLIEDCCYGEVTHWAPLPEPPEMN